MKSGTLILDRLVIRGNPALAPYWGRTLAAYGALRRAQLYGVSYDDYEAMRSNLAVQALDCGSLIPVPEVPAVMARAMRAAAKRAIYNTPLQCPTNLVLDQLLRSAFPAILQIGDLLESLDGGKAIEEKEVASIWATNLMRFDWDSHVYRLAGTPWVPLPPEELLIRDPEIRFFLNSSNLTAEELLARTTAVFPILHSPIAERKFRALLCSPAVGKPSLAEARKMLRDPQYWEAPLEEARTYLRQVSEEERELAMHVMGVPASVFE